MTKLTGRYVEFEMFTLSFSEFLDMKAYAPSCVKGSHNIANGLTRNIMRLTILAK